MKQDFAKTTLIEISPTWPDSDYLDQSFSKILPTLNLESLEFSHNVSRIGTRCGSRNPSSTIGRTVDAFLYFVQTHYHRGQHLE